MDADELLLEAEVRMEKCIEYLQTEFRSMRTGRANPGLVENLKVNYYGAPTPLKQLANIGAPEPSLLVIRPFDPSVIGEVEKAILKSDIGIAPASDGKVLRLAIPPLSEERRRQLVGKAKSATEEAKVSIRNVRRDANKKIEDIDGISEDDARSLKDDIQELTKKYEGQAGSMVDKKTDELMEM